MFGSGGRTQSSESLRFGHAEVWDVRDLEYLPEHPVEPFSLLDLYHGPSTFGSPNYSYMTHVQLSFFWKKYAVCLHF